VANYNSNARSFLAGLSDFWLLYFKEIDQLTELYRGTEILVGQAYLDLMGLLLNASVKDTLLFNKEYFKLLTIRENDLHFVKGSAAESDRFVYTLPDDIVLVRHMNNRIFLPTESLDKDVEYFVNDDDRTLEFKFDPMNAYLETTYGSGNGALRLRTRYRGAAAQLIRVWLNDTGAPLSITASGYDITIVYDGPANTNTTTAKSIVAQINTDVLFKDLLFAEVAGLGTGTAPPPGTVGLAPLGKFSVNPLDFFGVRNVDVLFGGQLTAATVTNWVTLGVQKGDVLRLLSGPTVGSPEDAEINLVREGALYLKTGGTLAATAGGVLDFVVLRKPANDESVSEPIAVSGVVTQSGIDGAVTAATREFTSPTAVFSDVHLGEVVELLGVQNLGYGRIIDVVNPNTIVLGVGAAFNEGPIGWNLLTVLDPANINTDGNLVNNLDGTATFTALSASFVNIDVAGTVLKIFRGAALERYEITGYTSPTVVTIAAAATVANGAGLTWGWARFKTPPTTIIFSPPAAWPNADSLSVVARREVDDQIVLLGRDYRVDYATGIISAITVWRPAADNTATYTFRYAVVENITPLQLGADGTLLSGSPDTFSSPTAAFTPAHVGSVIRVLGSGLLPPVTNNRTFVIASVISPTLVTLTSAQRVVTTVDPNNGALSWQLLRRGVLATQQTTSVAQSAFWCPDILVDRFSLYNTYGYLIDRYERSSEAYRALIRGIFQLFMLGPTLERFEAAINVVAGLQVIRDDGEIFLGYDNGAEATGIDGFLDYTSREFTAASATFVFADINKYLYISSGANANKLFKIQSIISPTKVLLETFPSTDGPVNWELTSTAEQTVSTSRIDYVFDRQVPLRPGVVDNANVGVKIFRAFEVLTSVFECTDYVEDPTWWELIQIPAELMPNQSGSRRQSSTTLYENVVDPSDEGRLGDPGFYIGADDEGYVPPSSLIRSGIADGVTTGDPLFPYSNNVFFDSASGAFTNADVGNYLNITLGSFLIEARVSATRIKIQSFVDVPDLNSLLWEIRTGTLPKRHKAAFVILDKVLKHHLFDVKFDAALLPLLSITVFKDLQELVFVAKPTYTFIALTPALFFSEALRVTEDFEETAILGLGGGAGEIIALNENPLTVIGSSWTIGNWFRYVDKTGTFAAPTATVPAVLGAPAVGFEFYVNKAYVTPTDFTSGGAPIQVGGLVETSNSFPAAGASITVVLGESYINLPAASLIDAYIGCSIEITGSGAGNNGTYTIGAVVSDAQARVFRFPLLVPEAGLTWQLVSTGGVQGKVSATAQGQVIFEDLTGVHTLATSVGDRIRRPFVQYLSNQSWRVHSVIDVTHVYLAEDSRLIPVDVPVTVTSGVVSPVTIADIIFLPQMALATRVVTNYATSLRERYYLEFTSGPDAGTRFYIGTYQSTNAVILLGAVTDTASDTAIFGVERSPVVVAETSDWEHVRDQILFEAAGGTHNTIDLSATPPQDANPLVNYAAYGVREPIDPTLSVFAANAGDTYYHIGMPDPRQHRGKKRTGRDVDMFESPVQIKVTP